MLHAELINLKLMEILSDFERFGDGLKLIGVFGQDLLTTVLTVVLMAVLKRFNSNRAVLLNV